MDDQTRATQPQIRLIEDLYATLRIRNTSLYGGTQPAQLTKQRASEVIDVLTLRKLSGELGRPVTADLANPVQVREQLARVEQLTDGHHARLATASKARAQQLLKVRAVSDSAEPREAAASRVRVLPHLRRREQPQGRVTLTAEQLAMRAAELDRVKEPRLDAASRYTDATGYGSAASYHGNNSRSPSDAPELTDAQERKIIELQDTGDDATVSSTVVEASEYLDQTLAPAEPLPPTERQIAYLHKLERQAGKSPEQLSHPGTRQGASRRIQRLVSARSERDDSSVAHELAATIAYTRAASPHTISEVTASASAVIAVRPGERTAPTGAPQIGSYEEGPAASPHDGR